MKTQLSGFHVFALVLVILGAINLGLTGIFEYDLIKSILGNQATLVRIVYALIGISGVYLLFATCKDCCHKDKCEHKE
jgi:uncharacterized protein